MNNYICINDVKTELTPEQVSRIRDAVGIGRHKLTEIEVGGVCRIGDHELIVLEKSGDTTAVARKDLYRKNVRFGSSNNYNGSNVDKLCVEFADEIAAVVGRENVVEYTVDLTSDDGLKDYGKIRRRGSSLTAAQYRRYVDVLDQHPVKDWWWLATAFSTGRHGNTEWVKCVSPSGYVYNYDHCSVIVGVRPFCILKSNIFVSC